MDVSTDAERCQVTDGANFCLFESPHLKGNKVDNHLESYRSAWTFYCVLGLDLLGGIVAYIFYKNMIP